jgi:hypothetical protein
VDLELKTPVSYQWGVKPAPEPLLARLPEAEGGCAALLPRRRSTAAMSVNGPDFGAPLAS